jgi:hypothetical protein
MGRMTDEEFDDLMYRARSSGFINHYTKNRTAIPLRNVEKEEIALTKAYEFTHFIVIPYEHDPSFNFLNRFARYIDRLSRIEDAWTFGPIIRDGAIQGIAIAHLFAFRSEEDMIQFRLVW